MSDPIIIDVTDRVATIRFNRPELRNPLSITVIEVLQAGIEKLAADSKIRGLIFTGSEDVFASGADLREIAAVTTEGAPEFALRGQKLMMSIAAFPKSTAAAVNGYCFGGALDLALACDRRVASPDAVFCHPGVGLGIITGWGGTQRLPRLIGMGRAMEILLTARRVMAADALQIGLVDQISESPVETLLSEHQFYQANKDRKHT